MMASPVFFLVFIFFSLSYSSPVLLPLTHSLSSSTHHHFTNTTTLHHLLKSTAARSSARLRRHRHEVSVPLSPGADYTLSFSLASQTISLYMDTGSDVVWVPCHPFECILCEGKYSPSAIPHPGPLNLSSSSAAPTPCKSSACSAVHSSLPSSDLCAIANCPLDSIETDYCHSFSCPPFYYAYGDGSFVASLYQDTLSISTKLKLPKFTFGCANTALGEPIGVSGFGRGPLSLPAQLAAASPEIGNYFSYCLISHSFDAARVSKPSPLILGRRQNKMKKNEITSGDDDDVVDYTYTPMLDNPKHAYFYCVGLEAVSVGRKKITAPVSLRRVDRRGDGGMVVDSGTTFTMLPKKLYKSVVAEFDHYVGAVFRRARAVEERTGLSPCYYGKVKFNVPDLVFHFGVGGVNDSASSAVAMPRRNYFYEFLHGDGKMRVGCLMVMDGGDESGGPAGLLGNYQQQGFEVVYDLEEKRVGFAKRKCASLWDSLS